MHLNLLSVHFIRLYDWRCINNFSTSVHVINIGTYTANWKMNYDQLKSLVMVIKTILCHVFIRFIMNSLNEPFYLCVCCTKRLFVPCVTQTIYRLLFRFFFSSFSCKQFRIKMKLTVFCILLGRLRT